MNRALGIDLGTSRVGLALSDEAFLMAHPLQTLSFRSVEETASDIVTIAREKNVTHIILGLPKNMNGTEGPAAQHARAFAEHLRGLCDIPVILWDERMTTLGAQRALHEAGHNTRSSRKVIDQVAAQSILQGWMDSQCGGIG